MPSVMMGLLDAKQLAAALVPHASRDDVTPVLTQIALGGEHGQYAVATDRYTVGRYDLTNVVIGDMPTEVVLIPWHALAALRTLGKATLPNNIDMLNYRVVFDTLTVGKLTYLQAKVLWHDEALGDMVHWMRTWLIPSSYGNFPPVAKLFRGVKAGGSQVNLGPEHVTKFTGYAKTINSSMRVTLTEGTNEARLSPILVEVGKRFKGLIQPYRPLDADQFGPDLLAENAKLDAEAEGEQ